jgi:hypothetical protein
MVKRAEKSEFRGIKRTFLELFSFYPLISRKFPDFCSKFSGQNWEIKFLTYFTDDQSKLSCPVQA